MGPGTWQLFKMFAKCINSNFLTPPIHRLNPIPEGLELHQYLSPQGFDYMSRTLNMSMEISPEENMYNALSMSPPSSAIQN